LLDQPEHSPRELAVRFTGEEKYFVSEASVYRLLMSHDLIVIPAHIVTKAVEAVKHKNWAPSDVISFPKAHTKRPFDILHTLSFVRLNDGGQPSALVRADRLDRPSPPPVARRRRKAMLRTVKRSKTCASGSRPRPTERWFGRCDEDHSRIDDFKLFVFVVALAVFCGAPSKR
jgi:hypothetical protein